MDCDFSPSSPHLLPNGLFSPQNRISFELLALSGLSGFSTFKGGKMLIFQGFTNSRIVREFPPFSFKVRIATLTRNQFVGNHTWVRIPPAAPRRSKLCIACSDLCYKSDCAHAAAPPFQTANACAGLRFDETGTLVWAHLFRRHNAYRSKLCIACSDLFYKSERTCGELSICSPALQPKILVDNFFGI